MASSAISHAMDSLLDILEEAMEARGATDAEKALLENSDAVLTEYVRCVPDDADRLGDQVRMQLALVVQHINQEFPELTGSRELQDATQALSTPHLPASAASGYRAGSRVGAVPDAPVAPGEGDVADPEDAPGGAAPEHRTDGGMVEQDLNLSERRGEHSAVGFNAYDGDENLVNEYNAEKNASQAETGEHGTEFRAPNTDTEGAKGPNVLETKTEPKGFDALEEVKDKAKGKGKK